MNSLEKYAPARMQLDAFIVANPTSPNLADARYRRAECSFYLQEHRVAIDQLSDYLTRHEDHGLANWARLMLGNSYNSIGDWNKAFSTLQALWDSSPEAQILPDTGFALGRAMEGQNRQN